MNSRQKNRVHIAIFEASRIIFDGLQSILYQSDIDCKVYFVETLDDLLDVLNETAIDILISNPMQFLNREKEVRKLRKNHPSLTVVGVDCGHIPKSSTFFDAAFSLYDSEEHIVHLLTKLGDKNSQTAQNKGDDENLSEREIDVLIGLVNGKSNKEIAESLNISIHTVVSHRKNITLKTGIRSQAGLTIYAISKEIVTLTDFS